MPVQVQSNAITVGTLPANSQFLSQMQGTLPSEQLFVTVEAGQVGGQAPVNPTSPGADWRLTLHVPSQMLVWQNNFWPCVQVPYKAVPV